MGSLGGDINLGSYGETASDISIEDRLELEHAHNYDIYDQEKTAYYIVSPNRPSESAPSVLEPNLIRPSTSYILTRSDHLESNVDCWIENSNFEDRWTRRRDEVGVQPSLMAEHRGVLASVWYILALLPMLSRERRRWCSPTNSIVTLLNLVDILTTYLKQIGANIWTMISRTALEQILHECFVVAMDFAMALHAFVFLVLSVYQV